MIPTTISVAHNRRTNAGWCRPSSRANFAGNCSTGRDNNRHWCTSSQACNHTTSTIVRCRSRGASHGSDGRFPRFPSHSRSQTWHDGASSSRAWWCWGRRDPRRRPRRSRFRESRRSGSGRSRNRPGPDQGRSRAARGSARHRRPGWATEPCRCT